MENSMEMISRTIFSLLVGSALGYIFFWGLWKTVERISSVKNPYLWMFVSFIIRTIIVVTGFYILLQLNWQFAAIGLIGFIIIRMILLRRFGKLTSANPKSEG